MAMPTNDIAHFDDDRNRPMETGKPASVSEPRPTDFEEAELHKTRTQLEQRRITLEEQQLRQDAQRLEFDRLRYSADRESKESEASEAEQEKVLAQKRERLKTVTMPLVILLLTFLLTTCLGLLFQSRAFRGNELFRAQLDQIVRQRAELVAVMQDVEEAWRLVRADEVYAEKQVEHTNQKEGPDAAKEAKEFYCTLATKSVAVETLRRVGIRCTALAEVAKTLATENDVSKNLEQFKIKLGALLDCKKSPACGRCTADDSDILLPLLNALAAYSRIENNLVRGAEVWRF